MTNASVSIISSALSPSTKTVRCTQVIVGGKRNIVANPNTNSTNLAYGQTQGIENTLYTLQGVLFTGESGVFTYEDLITLLKLNYDDTNAPLLLLTYGKSGATQVLSDFAGGTTGIKVLFKDFSFPINASESVGGYLSAANITLMETR